jgi:ubiquinone biosynthesis protein
MAANYISRSLTFAVLFISRTIRIWTLSILVVPAAVFVLIFKPGFGPRLLRWYLEACGAAFVKAGQILAMRYDFLPEAYCLELSKLLDQLRPVSVDQIRAVIEEDLQRPVAECYAEFDSKPLASASIAQVHRATLTDGTRVVVKVMRPQTQQLFRIDLTYVSLLGKFLETFEPFGSIGVGRIFRELIYLTREELDFRREARNIERMHQRMACDDIDHYAPRIYPDLCSKEVITMEQIKGVSVSEIITALEAGDEESLQTWAAAGISPRRAARLLMRSVLEQTMRHRLFHADPHAANLILTEGGTLAWVDFGMLGSLDERLWTHQFKLREAVADNKIDEAYHHLLATFEPIPLVDLSRFEADAKEYLRDWIASSESSFSTISEKSSAFFFIRIFDAIRRAKLTLPLGLMRLFRTIIVADIVMLKLDPQIDWMPVMKDFIADEQRRRLVAMIEDGFSRGTINSALLATMNLPRTALSVSEWVQTQLPDVGRMYRQQMTRFERITAVVLRYSQLGLALIVLALLGGRFIAPRFLAERGWLQLGAMMQSYGLLLALLGIVLMLMLQKLLREFRQPTPR